MGRCAHWAFCFGITYKQIKERDVLYLPVLLRVNVWTESLSLHKLCSKFSQIFQSLSDFGVVLLWFSKWETHFPILHHKVVGKYAICHCQRCKGSDKIFIQLASCLLHFQRRLLLKQISHGNNFKFRSASSMIESSNISDVVKSKQTYYKALMHQVLLMLCLSSNQLVYCCCDLANG